jgi:hypothetical protein
LVAAVCALTAMLPACSGKGNSSSDASASDTHSTTTTTAAGDSAPIDYGISTSDAGSPMISGCSVFPANFIFNTPINTLPVDPNSAAYISELGSAKAYLDTGTDTSMTTCVANGDCWGIPYNVVAGNSLTWTTINVSDTEESDCATTTTPHTAFFPCTANTTLLPVPANPLIEGGIITADDGNDHHLLLLDADTCEIWEAYSTIKDGNAYDESAIAHWALNSTALREAGATSADAAGFPMIPLLAKQEEAATGTINHALRFTMTSSHIRTSYVWPARHLTTNGTSSTNLPPMGQLFRLKASYTITATDTQAKAILQALQTYGMYLADGGSDMHISGVTNANWSDAVLGHGNQITAVAATDFEAVDITAITGRAGFDVNSGAVPP